MSDSKPKLRKLLLGLGLLVLAVGYVVSREVESRLKVKLNQISSPSDSEGHLVICGGGEIPNTIRQTFIDLAGGTKAKLVLIPGVPEDESSYESYIEPWREFEPISVQMLCASSREQADDGHFASMLDDATGVWFGGGQQNWLMNRYSNTLVEHKLHEVLKRRGVVGGTSAGAAVMSDIILLGGRKTPQIGKGFGFMPQVVIDQHFLKRNRFQRLRSVLDQHNNLLGLGIDEQAAIVYSLASDHLRVIGNSYVVACIPRNKRLDIEFLQAGDECQVSDLRMEESLISGALDQVFFE